MQTFFEVVSHSRLDPTEIIEDFANSNAQSLLIDEGVLPDEFFDLSTGIAGELLHKVCTYRVRLACVVPDVSSHSSQFQALVREANRGREIRFFSSREEAIKWLESD